MTYREKLLSNIAQLVSKFVHDVSIKSGLSEKVASEAGGRIYTSGSYRWILSFPFSSKKPLMELDWEYTDLDQILIRYVSVRGIFTKNTFLASFSKCSENGQLSRRSR